MTEPIKIPEAQRQELFVHIVPPKDEHESNKPSPTIQKLMKVAACILIALGVALIVWATISLGLGAAAIMSAAALSAAQASLPVGIVSLVAGCHMLSSSHKVIPTNLESIEMGPFTFGY